MKIATTIYLPGGNVEYDKDKPWAIGYSHHELLTDFRFERQEYAIQFGKVYCKNQGIKFIE